MPLSTDFRSAVSRTEAGATYGEGVDVTVWVTTLPEAVTTRVLVIGLGVVMLCVVDVLEADVAMITVGVAWVAITIGVVAAAVGVYGFISSILPGFLVLHYGDSQVHQ